MRITNIEKYRKYETVLDKIASDFCKQFFPVTPKYLYSIGKNCRKYDNGGYYIRKSEVVKILYHFKNEFMKPDFNKRPSNNNIARIKLLSETITASDMSEDNICVHVKDGNTSWGFHLKDFKNGNVSENIKDIQILLQKEIEHYKEYYLVKDGQFACAYCGKATDNDKKVTDVVIARQYPNFRKSFDYCSKKCASYNQMAHEG